MHDSHIHLALEPLKSNVSEILNEFESLGGKYILTQGTDLLDFKDSLDIAKTNPKIIQVALGLHPTFFEETTVYKRIFKNLTAKSETNIKKFQNTIKENIENIKAIGETGLDYYQIKLDTSFPTDTIEEIIHIQKLSFSEHINLAKEYNLPLSIHSRDINSSDKCTRDTIDIVAKEGKGILRGCFHSYTGNLEFLKEILDLGFFIGFNAIITYKSGENVREILKQTPIERILFETDGPFLPPQSVRKNKKIKEKYAKPSHIKEIIEVAAEVKNVSSKYLENASDENYKNLLLRT
jgi:TatD DNase family protein